MRSTLLAHLALSIQDSPAPDTGAPPAGQAPSGGPFGMSWIPLLLVFAIFYFIMILPERKKQKKRAAMLAAMKKGDRVMTSGGLYGTVAQVADDAIVLQVADGVRLRFNRAAIQTIEADGADEKSDKTAKQEIQKA
jgi:preprotein translocase subunit YajC